MNAMIAWMIIISCDLDDFNKDKFKGAKINGINKLIDNKADAIINFWSGNMHEQLAHLNTALHKCINPDHEIPVTDFCTRSYLPLLLSS